MAQPELETQFSSAPKRPKREVALIDSPSGWYFSDDKRKVKKADIDAMLRDADIAAAWELSCTLELSTGWHFEYSGENEELGDELIAHVEYQFEHCNRMLGYTRGLYDILYNMSFAPLYGHVVNEPVWCYDASLDQVMLSKYKPLPPDNDVFMRNSYGELVGYYQDIDPYHGEGNPHDPAEFDILVWKKDGEYWGNYYGESVLRPCWRYYDMKNNLQKYSMDYMENKAVGPRVIEHPPDMDAESITLLDNAAKKLKPRSVMRLPGPAYDPTGTKLNDGVKIHTAVGENKTPEFKTMIEMCNSSIFRALFVPKLALDGSSSEGHGSYSLGVAQISMILYQVLRTRQRYKTPYIDNLVRKMCLFNFGDKLESDDDGNPIFPTFCWNELEADQLEKSATAIKTLIDAGEIRPHEPWLREFLNLPEYIPDDKADLPGLLSDEIDTPPPIPAPTYDPTLSEDDAVVKDEGVEAEAEAALPKRKDKPKLVYDESDAHTSAVWSRAESKLRARIADWLERLINRTINIYEKNITKADRADDLDKTVAEQAASEAAAPGPDFNYNAVIDKIGVTPDEQSELMGIFNNVGKASAYAGLDDLISGFDGADVVDIPKIKPQGAIKYIEQQNKLWASKFSSDMTNQIRQTILSGLNNGESIRKMKGNLEKLFTVQLSKTDKGQVETAIRTNVNAAYNRGRDEAMKASDIVEGYVLNVVQDSRTSDICEPLAGMVVLKTDPDYDEYRPPLHYNCRTTMSPFTRYDRLEDTAGLLDRSYTPAEGFGG